MKMINLCWRFSKIILFCLFIFIQVSPKICGAETTLQSPLSFKSLKNFILSKNIRSIDQLVPLLPQEYRDKYVLMYQSRSRQDASTKYPRVISFGSNGTFILTFNGDPKSDGYNIIEVMEYSDKDGFKLSEIRFPDNNEKLNEAVKFENSSNKNSRNKSVVFETNPNSCLECHGSPSRPLWNSYFLWPGAYGSSDSEMTRGSQELDGYIEYITKVRPNSQRYSALTPLQVNGIKNEEDGKITVTKDFVKVEGDQTSGPEVLTSYLAVLNAKKIFQDISKLKRSEFNPILKAFAGRCFGTYTDKEELVSFENFYPNPTEVKENVDSLLKHSSSIELTERLNRISIINKFQKGTTNEVPRYLRPVSGFKNTSIYSLDDRYQIYLAFLISQMGLNLSNYALSVSPNSMANAGGTAEFPKVLSILIEDPSSDILSKSNYFLDFPNSLSLEECQKLSALSQKNLENIKITKVSIDIPDFDHKIFLESAEEILSITNSIFAPPRIVQRCSTCHEGEHPKGPRIPFSNSRALQVLFKEPNSKLKKEILNRINATDASRMPPSGEITEKDRAEIFRYLEQIPDGI